MMEDFIDYSAIAMLAGLLVCIFFNGFLSMAETAIMEAHKTPLEKLADDGNIDAADVLDILEDPEHLLSVVQIGITFTGILIGVIAGALIAPSVAPLLDGFMPHPTASSLVISIVVISYITLILGEFLPKKIAMQAPEQILMRGHHSLRRIESIMHPVLAFLSGSANIVLSSIGINPDFEDTVTEDEVKDLIEQGTEDGTFEKEEQHMVDRIFHMSDQNAYSLMTPRTQMIWLDLDDSLQHNLDIIKENPSQVFAAARGSLDNFSGVIYAKELLDAMLSDKPAALEPYIQKPLFVPRSMETFRVLQKFRSKGMHEAVVVDEYGGVIGFITLSDIMEEIIGDDSVNGDESEAPQITPRSDDSWYVDGLLSIDEFKKYFDIDDELPDEEDAHYQTMGGFLTAFFGYIPKAGEKRRWGDYMFEVADMDRARIDKIMVTFKPLRK